MRNKEKEYNLHKYDRIRTEQLYYDFKNSQKYLIKNSGKPRESITKDFV